jgi:1,2-diacylglycerol 3-alpha-glucosyltransferase
MLIRKLFHLKFKIIFANGDALEPPSYDDFDQIQHLYPDSFEKAVQSGIGEEKMHLLPNCVFYATLGESREQLRHQFGFQTDDFIIISVAAWNRYQKRLDYLIREVAALGDPSVKLRTPGGGDERTEVARRH